MTTPNAEGARPTTTMVDGTSLLLDSYETSTTATKHVPLI